MTIATQSRRPGPAAVLLRRWLLLMGVVAPTVAVGLMLHALTLGGSWLGQLGRLYGYHLTLLAVIAGVTLMLVFAATRVIGGGAGVRLRDLSDLSGRDLAKRLLLVSPIYLAVTGILMMSFRHDPGMIIPLGLAALTPATIEDFLSSMNEGRD